MPAFSNHKIVIKLTNLEMNKDLYIRSLHIKTHSWVLRVDSSSYKNTFILNPSLDQSDWNGLNVLLTEVWNWAPAILSLWLKVRSKDYFRQRSVCKILKYYYSKVGGALQLS